MTPEQRKAKIEKLLKQNLKAEEVHCDCPVYSSTPKVCQHALAAAEDMGILSDYLTSKNQSCGPQFIYIDFKGTPKISWSKE